MKIYFTALITFIIISGYSFSQSNYNNILIHGPWNDYYSPEEVSITINPKNTNQLVGGSNIDKYYYTSDAGNTWVGNTITSTYTVWGDPALFTDTSGNFYYLHLTDPPQFIDRIVCQKSTDAGQTWTNGTYMGYWPGYYGEDKAWGCADFTHGSRGNWIYVSWTRFDNYGVYTPSDSSNIFFSRSADGGNTWVQSQGTRLNQKAGDCVDSDDTMEGAVPCIGPNGEVYVSWAGSLSHGNDKLFFTSSTDGGTTWLANNVKAGTQPGGWDMYPPPAGIQRANGLPITCCDISNGPYRGTIYINYADSVSPGDHDIKIIKSTNGGLDWSNAIRVNDDPAGKEQFFTWLTIDQVTGYLYDVFYDRRNYSDAETDVYVAHSTDGGNTWTNERVSSSPFTPNSSTFFGDYNNITAYNGTVRPIWTRLSNGQLSIYTAIMTFPVAVASEGNNVPKNFALDQNYPNPFNPSTTIRFSIPPLKGARGMTGQSIVKLVIHDILGKEVATLFSEPMGPGTYEIHWDASQFSSGVYFYSLESGSFKDTKKLMLIK